MRRSRSRLFAPPSLPKAPTGALVALAMFTSVVGASAVAHAADTPFDTFESIVSQVMNEPAVSDPGAYEQLAEHPAHEPAVQYTPEVVPAVEPPPAPEPEATAPEATPETSQPVADATGPEDDAVTGTLLGFARIEVRDEIAEPGSWLRLRAAAVGQADGEAVFAQGAVFGVEPATAEEPAADNTNPWYWAQVNAEGLATFNVPVYDANDVAEAVGEGIATTRLALATTTATDDGQVGYLGATANSRLFIAGASNEVRLPEPTDSAVDAGPSETALETPNLDIVLDDPVTGNLTPNDTQSILLGRDLSTAVATVETPNEDIDTVVLPEWLVEGAEWTEERQAYLESLDIVLDIQVADEDGSVEPVEESAVEAGTFATALEESVVEPVETTDSSDDDSAVEPVVTPNPDDATPEFTIVRATVPASALVDDDAIDAADQSAVEAIETPSGEDSAVEAGPIDTALETPSAAAGEARDETQADDPATDDTPVPAAGEEVAAFATLSVAIVPTAEQDYAEIIVYVGGARGETPPPGAEFQLFSLVNNSDARYYTNRGFSLGQRITEPWATQTTSAQTPTEVNFRIPIITRPSSADATTTNTYGGWYGQNGGISGATAGSRFAVVATTAPFGWDIAGRYTSSGPAGFRTGNSGNVDIAKGEPTGEWITPYWFPTAGIASGAPQRSGTAFMNATGHDRAGLNDFNADPTALKSNNTANTGGNASGRTRSNGTWPLIAPNPDFPQQCGIDAALVLDFSGSIGRLANDNYSGVQRLRNAAASIIGALTGTPSQMAVYSFSTNSPADKGANIPLTSIVSSEGATKLTNQINTWIQEGGTNWDHPLRRIAASEDNYDVVFFVTDGNPTTWDDQIGEQLEDGDAWGFRNSFRPVEEAIVSANAVKQSDTRILAIGVSYFTLGEPTATNLRSISGTTPFNPAQQNFTTADFFQIEQFESIKQLIRNYMFEACAPSINVNKRIVDESVSNPIAYPRPTGFSSDPGKGWQFEAELNNSAFNLDVTNSWTTTNDLGNAQFNLNVDPYSAQESGSTITITEKSQSGYSIVQSKPTSYNSPANAVCYWDYAANTNPGMVLLPESQITSGTDKDGNPTITLSGIPVDAMITCEVVNRKLTTPTASVANVIGTHEGGWDWEIVKSVNSTDVVPVGAGGHKFTYKLVATPKESAGTWNHRVTGVVTLSSAETAITAGSVRVTIDGELPDAIYETLNGQLVQVAGNGFEIGGEEITVEKYLAAIALGVGDDPKSFTVASAWPVATDPDSGTESGEETAPDPDTDETGGTALISEFEDTESESEAEETQPAAMPTIVVKLGEIEVASGKLISWGNPNRAVSVATITDDFPEFAVAFPGGVTVSSDGKTFTPENSDAISWSDADNAWHITYSATVGAQADLPGHPGNPDATTIAQCVLEDDGDGWSADSATTFTNTTILTVDDVEKGRDTADVLVCRQIVAASITPSGAITYHVDYNWGIEKFVWVPSDELPTDSTATVINRGTDAAPDMGAWLPNRHTESATNTNVTADYQLRVTAYGPTQFSPSGTLSLTATNANTTAIPFSGLTLTVTADGTALTPIVLGAGSIQPNGTIVLTNQTLNPAAIVLPSEVVNAALASDSVSVIASLTPDAPYTVSADGGSVTATRGTIVDRAATLTDSFPETDLAPFFAARYGTDVVLDAQTGVTTSTSTGATVDELPVGVTSEGGTRVWTFEYSAVLPVGGIGVSYRNVAHVTPSGPGGTPPGETRPRASRPIPIRTKTTPSSRSRCRPC